jgi:hypothetical protein
MPCFSGKRMSPDEHDKRMLEQDIPARPFMVPGNESDWRRLEQRMFWLAVAAMVILACVADAACYALRQWGAAGAEAAKTFQAINRNCDGGKEACGTLADVNQTLHTIRGTFGVIEAAGRHEDAQLTTLDGQEKTLFNGLNGVVTKTQGTLDGATGVTKAASNALAATQGTIEAARPVLVSLGKTSDSLTKTSDSLGNLAKSAQKRVDDPRVDVFLTHLDGTATHIDAVTGDVQTVFDPIAHPQPCKGRACVFVKTLRIIDAAHNVPEFGYWTDQLINSLRGK